MTGALPPSSRWSRLTASAAMCAMRLPVSVSPVTEIDRDGRVPDERVADRLAAAGDDVEDAGREDVGGDLGEDERGERGPDRRLEHDRVASRERRADLPAGHVERVVPRRDRGHDADRIAADERRVAGEVLVGGLALHHPGRAREEAQVVDHRRDLVDGRADRLAAVAALESAELVRAGLDRVGELQEHEAPVLGRAVLPRLECGRGRRRPRGRRPRAPMPAPRRSAGRSAGLTTLAVSPLALSTQAAADELLVAARRRERIGHLILPSGRCVGTRRPSGEPGASVGHVATLTIRCRVPGARVSRAPVVVAHRVLRDRARARAHRRPAAERAAAGGRDRPARARPTTRAT